MLIRHQKNDKYELYKKLIKEKIILGILDEDGRLETDDKISYSIIERINDELIKDSKKNKWRTATIFFIIGLFLSGLAAVILFYFKVIP